MDRRILFICESHNFLAKAMEKSLAAAHFEVVSAQPDLVELQLMHNIPDIFIVYLEGAVDEFTGSLKYLKKLIEDKTSRLLYLIGNPAEIGAALSIIPNSIVAATFERPVAINDILMHISAALDLSAITGGRKRVLVVDDDPIYLRSIKMWLSKDYDVYMANSGVNAITMLAHTTVDLILLDYEMPVASGLQVYQMLKSEPFTAHIPVIFLTSKNDRDIVTKVLAENPQKYLLKTMQPDLLKQSIDDFFKGN
ncbi:MAG: response regulator [Treponema sp.]|nr:response regulator [Treponema sp.]